MLSKIFSIAKTGTIALFIINNCHGMVIETFTFERCIYSFKPTKMKKLITGVLVLFFAVLFFSAFTTKAFSNMKGRIDPKDGAAFVWAIGLKDTVTAPIINGSFIVEVKPGNYVLVIDAKDPYKDVRLENIQLKDGQTIDLGVLLLR